MKHTNILFSLISIFILFCRVNAAQKPLDVKQLVEIFNQVDNRKNELDLGSKSKLFGKDRSGATLLCMKCNKNLFEGDKNFVISHFGADEHVHIIHKTCFDALGAKVNPCPFCNQVAPIRGVCEYYEKMEKQQALNSFLCQELLKFLASGWWAVYVEVINEKTVSFFII